MLQITCKITEIENKIPDVIKKWFWQKNQQTLMMEQLQMKK